MNNNQNTQTFTPPQEGFTAEQVAEYNALKLTESETELFKVEI